MTTRVADLLSKPWAITPEKFEAILEVYERHAAGARLDLPQPTAANGALSGQADPGYTVQSGVAVVPIDGILSKRVNMLSVYSGGTSTQVLTDTIQQAAADPSVDSMLLIIDSPGGEVDGTQLAAQAVADAAKRMPVLALLDGQCCSGAYWIASQAQQRFIVDGTTQVGSIGVVITHTDRSKANEQQGKRVTEITSGKYKRIASAHQPLSDDGRDVLQDQADTVYSVFVADVAAGLGASTDTVLSNMADGKVFIGQQAISAGLASGFATEGQLIAKLVAQRQQKLQNPGAQAPGRTTIPKAGAENMFVKSFESEAEYQAELQAAEARGRAAAAPVVNPNIAKSFEGVSLATKITNHIAKVRTEGRKITPAQALAELEAMQA